MFGPSGCGKSTLKKKLMSDYPAKFGFSISRKKYVVLTTVGIKIFETWAETFTYVTFSRMYLEMKFKLKCILYRTPSFNVSIKEHKMQHNARGEKLKVGVFG